MIRGSIGVAVVAVIVSLILHILGLSMTASEPTAPPAQQRASEAVDLSSSFEDLAEVPEEPPEPETAETPEPEAAEIPTSQALVASEDPQRVFAPDFGEAAPVRPDTVEPVEAQPTPPADNDEATRADAEDAQPVATDEVAETPRGEPATEEPPPEAEAPAPPVVAALDPSEEVAPADSEQAVTTSIRPRLPTRQPEADPGGAEDFADLRFPQQVIESPLTTFQREGRDAFTQSNRTQQSGGRRPGNSNVTNYAGQVLVHLNRSPSIFVPVRGFARVFFEINPDGTLAWVEITDSSGSTQIDSAAKRQVRAAAPFPPPPGGVSRKLSFFFQNG